MLNNLFKKSSQIYDFKKGMSLFGLGWLLFYLQLVAFSIFSFQSLIANLTYIFPLFLLGQYVGSLLCIWFSKSETSKLKPFVAPVTFLSILGLIFSKGMVHSWSILIVTMALLGFLITQILAMKKGYKGYIFELVGALFGFFCFSLALSSGNILLFSSGVLFLNSLLFLSLMPNRYSALGSFLTLTLAGVTVLNQVDLSTHSGYPDKNSLNHRDQALFANTLLQSNKGKLLSSSDSRLGRVDVVESDFDPWDLVMSGKSPEVESVVTLYIRNVLFTTFNTKERTKREFCHTADFLQDRRSFADILDPNKPLLVIGPGAGSELYCFDQFKDLEAVEINPGIFNALQKIDKNGIADRFKRLNLINDDGRSFLQKSSKKYAAIYLANVISFYAPSVGATSIENHLLTQEAFKKYFDHLEEGGVLILSYFFNEMIPSRIRLIKNILASVERESLEVSYIEQGTSESQVQGLYPGLMFVRLKPFTQKEMDFFSEFASEFKDTQLVSLEAADFEKIEREPIQTTTDLRPYFYYYSSDLKTFYGFIGLIISLLVLILVGLRVLKKQNIVCLKSIDVMFLGLIFGLSQISFFTLVNSFFMGIKTGYMLVTLISILGLCSGTFIYAKNLQLKSRNFLFVSLVFGSILFHVPTRGPVMMILVLFAIFIQFTLSSHFFCNTLYENVGPINRRIRSWLLSVSFLFIIVGNISSILIAQNLGMDMSYLVCTVIGFLLIFNKTKIKAA